MHLSRKDLHLKYIMHLKYLPKCSFNLFFSCILLLPVLCLTWGGSGTSWLSLPTEGPLQVVAPGPTWGHLYMFTNVPLYLFLHGSSTPHHIPIYGGS